MFTVWTMDECPIRLCACVYPDTDGDGACEHLFNEDLITLGLAHTTTFSHQQEFERLREEAEEHGAELWGAAPLWKSTDVKGWAPEADFGCRIRDLFGRGSHSEGTFEDARLLLRVSP